MSRFIMKFLSQVSGLYFNCALNSRGIQASGGYGKELANLISSGSTEIDMFSVDVARFQDSYLSNQDWLDQGTHESGVRFDRTLMYKAFSQD